MADKLIKKAGGQLGFPELISALHQIFDEDRVDVEEVKELLSSYSSRELDWMQFAKFDPHRYTRNLVDEGNGKFNLMILCWGEGMGSSIHDHANAHCFVKMLDGQLQEVLYDWPEDDADPMMNPRNIARLSRDQITYINDEIGLHRVENPSHTDVAVSLHLYCPPFEKCYTFDERTGEKRECKVTFWSKYGKRTRYQLPESCVADNCSQ